MPTSAPTTTPFTPSRAPSPTKTPKAEVISIEECSIKLGDMRLDKVYLDKVKVVVKNWSTHPIRLAKFVLSSNKHKATYPPIGEIGTIKPSERKEIEFTRHDVRVEFDRELATEEIKAKLELFGYLSGKLKLLAEKNINIPIPLATIGQTIPEVGRSRQNMSLTLLAWKESDIAVDGPYHSGQCYTFTARPGMKFIILLYQIQNNSKRPQEPPYLLEGEVATDKGYIYKMWQPPSGIHSEEYKPRKSTQGEIESLLGDCTCCRELLPGGREVDKDAAVFEIPKDETPIEVYIEEVPALIQLTLPATPTIIATPTPTPTSALTTQNLPYSWTEGPFLITIHRVFIDKEYTSHYGGDTWDWWRVEISYENKSNKTQWTGSSMGGIDIKIADLKLKTKEGNIYDVKYGGGMILGSMRFEPGESYDTSAIAFKVRRGEVPVELWFYKVIGQKPIIFKLENK